MLLCALAWIFLQWRAIHPGIDYQNVPSTCSHMMFYLCGCMLFPTWKCSWCKNFVAFEAAVGYFGALVKPILLFLGMINVLSLSRCTSKTTNVFLVRDMWYLMDEQPHRKAFLDLAVICPSNSNCKWLEENLIFSTEFAVYWAVWNNSYVPSATVKRKCISRTHFWLNTAHQSAPPKM